jgi:hypothetical protein
MQKNTNHHKYNKNLLWAHALAKTRKTDNHVAGIEHLNFNQKNTIVASSNQE